MKISLLAMDLVVNGGAQRQLFTFARCLQSLGHDVTTYAYRYAPEGCFPHLTVGLNIRAVELLKTKGSLPAPPANHGIITGARRHLLESRRLAALLTDPGDILNPHFRGATRASVLVKRRTGAPVVWMCNDARNWEQPGYRPRYPSPVQWIFDQVMRRLELPVVREIDRLVVLDHRVKRIVEGCYGRPAHVVHCGLEAEAFTERPAGRAKIRARHGIPGNAFLLLWLGFMEPHRRLADALEAVRRLANARNEIYFLVAGSDATAPAHAIELKQFVAEHGLEKFVRFSFTSVPEEELSDYYSSADALVYLCENQAWGLGVFEAMACGCPGIVSLACGAEEALEDRKTALLVPTRDPDAIGCAIRELIAAPGLGSRIAARGRAEVLPKLTWKKYTQGLLEVFELACEERRERRAEMTGEAWA